MEKITVSSSQRQELVDITSRVMEIAGKMGWKEGVLIVFCPHTTAGITINESADPSVSRDINSVLTRLVPEKDKYEHLEGNSDAHVKSSLLGCSEFLILQGGKPVLGTWQGLFFAEFDGPRSRKVYLQFCPGGD